MAKKKIDYAKKLKEALVSIRFNESPKKVTLEELNKKAKEARRLYNFDAYKSSLRSRISY